MSEFNQYNAVPVDGIAEASGSGEPVKAKPKRAAKPKKAKGSLADLPEAEQIARILKCACPVDSSTLEGVMRTASENGVAFLVGDGGIESVVLSYRTYGELVRASRE